MKRNMDVEWSYKGENGPDYWHTLCDWFKKGAEFPLQSPISLTKADAVSSESYQAPRFFYQNQLFTEKEFKNTIHFVPFSKKSHLIFNKERFDLVDIHFHRPSEHFLEEEQLPLECHLVHINEKQENLVCGVLMDLKKVGRITEGTAEWSYPKHQHRFDPDLFLPKKRSHFHYIGSLTTPPTVGPVHWFVFDEIVPLERTFINQFSEEIADQNFRPLQDKKGREIVYFN